MGHRTARLCILILFPHTCSEVRTLLLYSVMQLPLPVNTLLVLPLPVLEAEAFFPCLDQVQFQYPHLAMQPLAPVQARCPCCVIDSCFTQVGPLVRTLDHFSPTPSLTFALPGSDKPLYSNALSPAPCRFQYNPQVSSVRPSWPFL